MNLRPIAALAAALALALTACGPGEAEPQDRQLVVGASVAPNSMDPSTSDAAAIPQVLLYNVYETLLKIDGDGNLQPLLASEWAVTPDGATYTFELRTQAKFASGNPVNADAVVASVKRIIDDPDVLPVLKSRMDPVETVRAVDEDTVEFVLKQPSHNWLYSMAQTAGIIYDPAGIDTITTVPAGSGPFVFDSWVQGDSVVLKRNNEYWGTPTKLAGVTFKYYTDANVMNNAMPGLGCWTSFPTSPLRRPGPVRRPALHHPGRPPPARSCSASTTRPQSCRRTSSAAGDQSTCHRSGGPARDAVW